MIFLFPRWDMLIPWRVSMLNQVIQDAGLVCVKYSKRRYIIFNRSVGWWFLIIWYPPRRWWLYNPAHSGLCSDKNKCVYAGVFFGRTWNGRYTSIVVDELRWDINIQELPQRKASTTASRWVWFLKTTSFWMFRDVKKCGSSACW